MMEVVQEVIEGLIDRVVAQSSGSADAVSVTMPTPVSYEYTPQQNTVLIYTHPNASRDSVLERVREDPDQNYGTRTHLYAKAAGLGIRRFCDLELNPPGHISPCPEIKKSDIEKMVHWYVEDSVEDLLHGICYTNNVYEMPTLVECLLDLPIDYNKETTMFFTNKVFSTIMNGAYLNVNRQSAFWMEMSKRKTCPVATDLMKSFGRFFEKVFVKTDGCPFVQRLMMSKLMPYDDPKDMDDKFREAAKKAIGWNVRIAELLEILYPRITFISNRAMIRYMLHLTKASDVVSMHLLVLCWEKLGMTFEQQFLNQHDQLFYLPLNKAQNAICQIFGKLAKLACRNSKESEQRPSDLINTAELLIYRKLALISMQRARASKPAPRWPQTTSLGIPIPVITTSPAQRAAQQQEVQRKHESNKRKHSNSSSRRTSKSIPVEWIDTSGPDIAELESLYDYDLIEEFCRVLPKPKDTEMCTNL